jgi:hypothetical protein
MCISNRVELPPAEQTLTLCHKRKHDAKAFSDKMGVYEMQVHVLQIGMRLSTSVIQLQEPAYVFLRW